MSAKNILIYSTLNELSAMLAADLYKKITELSRENNEINIALSGGSTPQLLFKKLSEDYSAKIDWSVVNLYWVDERCVPPDHPESNFGNAKTVLIDKIKIPQQNVHRIKGEKDPSLEAARYSEEVFSNVQLKNNIPSFSIVLLGIGEDGHTASIFSDQMHLLHSPQIYVHSIHPVSKQSRITMTGKVINNTEYSYILVSGKSKAGIVKKILQKEPDAAEFPANYINPINNNLFWYLDAETAQTL